MANVLMMGLVFLRLGWVSVFALVLSFFFMSIMYPTHFALAIRVAFAAISLSALISRAGNGPAKAFPFRMTTRG